MDRKLLSGAAGLMAVAGMLFLFTMDSLIPGLLLVVSALCITVTMMVLRKRGGSEDDKRGR